MLQEKSNKRINFLTVIQSIFVPLTLIAGIYGMNFINMPELEYKYGYFIIIGVLVLVASGFLWYFYKHGWFD
jgi:magnesium transporter